MVTSASPRLRRDAGTVEDDVGHLSAAQALGALLSQHPTHGIDDIRLPGAVWSHNGRDAGGEIELCLVSEGLEARQFQPFEHGPVTRVNPDSRV